MSEPQTKAKPSDAEIAGAALGDVKPRLLISEAEPYQTIKSVGRALAGSGDLFDRGGPVRVVEDSQTRTHIVDRLAGPGIIRELDRIARPFLIKQGTRGSLFEEDTALSRGLAEMYLQARDEWNLRPLDGIAASPLLADDGSIQANTGYDPSTRLWCCKVPALAGLVLKDPSKADAMAALVAIRSRFATFAFADSAKREGDDGVSRVRLDEPPADDESGFLNALLTSVCRPSMDLAPALLVRGAGVSGSGTGKGLLVACLSAIAYGQKPPAITSGHSADEFEKRISAALIQSIPCVLLDNINGRTLKSDTLASALTERPAQIRKFGVTELLLLNSSAFIAVTGNSLMLAEDLVRRFIDVQLDAGTEDPESRKFPGDILAEVTQSRATLLAHLLTIWRWGRLAKQGQIHEGKPLGSYPVWGRWVRDPLLSLGCRDPAERVAQAKRRDPHREMIGAFFHAWYDIYGTATLEASELAQNVKDLLVPPNASRQLLASSVMSLKGTRVDGFMLVHYPKMAKWSAAKYSLVRTSSEESSAACLVNPMAELEALLAAA